MEEEREGGRPGLNTTLSQLGPFRLFSGNCWVFGEHKHSPRNSAANTWLRCGDPWPSLPVLRVSRGQTPGDVAHLEGDVLPVSVEGAGLWWQGVWGPGPQPRGFGRRRFPADLWHWGAFLHIGCGFSHVLHCNEEDNNSALKVHRGWISGKSNGIFETCMRWALKYRTS